jgi:hypothetical protein
MGGQRGDDARAERLKRERVKAMLEDGQHEVRRRKPGSAPSCGEW